MVSRVLLPVFLAMVLLVSACTQNVSQADIQNASKGLIICNPPYIRVGAECCLDRDNNSICDRDESPLTPAPSPTPTPTTQPPQVKTSASPSITSCTPGQRRCYETSGVTYKPGVGVVTTIQEGVEECTSSGKEWQSLWTCKSGEKCQQGECGPKTPASRDSPSSEPVTLPGATTSKVCPGAKSIALLVDASDARFQQSSQKAVEAWNSANRQTLFTVSTSATDYDVRVRFVKEATMTGPSGNEVGVFSARVWPDGCYQKPGDIEVEYGYCDAALVVILQHELGHALGLEHSTDPKNIMYPTLKTQELCPSQLTNRDNPPALIRCPSTTRISIRMAGTFTGTYQTVTPTSASIEGPASVPVRITASGGTYSVQLQSPLPSLGTYTLTVSGQGSIVICPLTITA